MTTIDIRDDLSRTTAARPVRTGPIRHWFGAWRRRHAQRVTIAELGRMNPYLLRDMGIEPQDVIDAIEGRSRSLLFNPVRKGE